MSLAVLDASAFLALLLRERGHELVASVLRDSVISAVNLAEVVGYYARSGVSELDIRSDLAAFPITCLELDDTTAFEAGLLLSVTRRAGLSLGDRVCLALTGRLGATAYTADRKWLTIAGPLGIDVKIIR